LVMGFLACVERPKEATPDEGGRRVGVFTPTRHQR